MQDLAPKSLVPIPLSCGLQNRLQGSARVGRIGFDRTGRQRPERKI